MIYHVVEEALWPPAGDYRGDTLATEGFIHCCTEEQLPFVLERFFRGRRGLLLLEIEETRLENVRWEAADGQTFPHVHGPIPVDAVVATRRIAPEE